MQLIFNEQNIITPYQRFLQKQNSMGITNMSHTDCEKDQKSVFLQSEIAGIAKWKHSN